MSTPAAPPGKCPSCGQALEANAPEGLCPFCLVRLGLDATLDGSGTWPVATPGSPRPAGTAPRLFGGYEILEEIDRGGMGVVYRALDRSLNRTVALKLLLLGPLASESFVHRFRVEAEAAAKLDHPNVVSIHEVGEVDGQHFISMRLIEGGNLGDWASRERSAALSGRADGGAAGDPASLGRWPERAARIVATVARAVHAAHQRGVLHRDLKPANVLVDADGTPFVSDFGLAKLLDAEGGTTRTLECLGSPNYMSPEQAAGKTKSVTTATDVWSLGAILYELLAGEPPFVADTPLETLRRVVDDPPAPLSARVAGLDRDLSTIAMKCLEKDPAARYGSAAAVADDIERWLRREPIEARPAGPVERCVKWARRNPRFAALLGASVVLVVLFVAGLGALSVRLASVAEESRRRLVDLNARTGERLLRDRDELLAQLWFVEALHLEKGDPAGERLHRYRVAAVSRLSPALLHLWLHEGPVVHAEFSPDGRLVVTSSNDGTARLWDTESGVAAGPPLRHGGPVLAAHFSANGTRLITVSQDRSARVWDVPSGAALTPPLEHDEFHVTPYGPAAALSPDGRWALTAASGRGARVWDAASGKLLRLLHDQAERVNFAAFSPDGRRIVTAASDRSARLWDPETGAEVGPSLAHRNDVLYAAFFRDGRRLITVASTDGYQVWDAGAAKALTPAFRPRGVGYVPAVSGDGSRAAVPSFDGTVMLCDTASGQRVHTLLHNYGVKTAAFSTGGDLVATASWDGAARVWDANAGSLAQPLLRHGGYVQDAVFSPDDRRLVTVCWDGSVRLWDLTRAESSHRVLSGCPQALSAELSRDGERVLAVSRQGAVLVLDPRTGESAAPPLGGAVVVTRAAFGPDGRKVVAAGADGRVVLWSSVEAAEPAAVFEHPTLVSDIEISPDGQRVLTSCNDGIARVWDAAARSRAPLRLEHGAPLVGAGFSPDGRTILAVTAGGLLWLWDATRGAKVAEPIRHEGEVACAAFSPDGRRVASACSDATQYGRWARVWHTASGQPLTPPLRHSDGVLVVEFSPDGRRVITGSEDATARIWDIERGAPLGAPLRHDGMVVWAAFSPDGLRAATASMDGSVGVWDTETCELIGPRLLHRAVVQYVAFGAGGETLLTLATDSKIRLWDVSAAKEPVDDLVRDAERLASHKLGPGGVVVPLDVESLRRVWEGQ